MSARPLYADREEAGHWLAAELAGYAGRRDLLVLALPRGGVPVAFPVAQALGAPLDVLVVRKLGVPGHPARAMGAIVAGKTVIVVDDGIATGATARAAVTALRALGPARIVVAAPVASPRAAEELARVADRVVCVAAPARFQAVEEFYRDFPQTSDEEVKALLRAAREPGGGAVHAGRAGRAGRAW